MAFILGGAFGLVWLYFWLRGFWFAAVIGTLFAGALWLAAGHINAWPIGTAIVSWLPFLGRAMIIEVKSAH